ncbi:MAG: DUF1080 domain-containing protein, partial [Pirellulales bacterium]
IVLFDGSSTDPFVDGKLIDGKYLGASGCYSKKKFGDHSLHIEFRTPFMPQARGQGRGNSGVYIQSRYEVQVLDSFGLAGEDNECGGIYKIAAPAVNRCFPPLAWQTYDYQFTAARYDEKGQKTKNARVTIRHNGVVIHDDLELPAGTPGRHAEGPGADSLFLQYHGNPVVYRNIWAVVKYIELGPPLRFHDRALAKSLRATGQPLVKRIECSTPLAMRQVQGVGKVEPPAMPFDGLDNNDRIGTMNLGQAEKLGQCVANGSKHKAVGKP